MPKYVEAMAVGLTATVIIMVVVAFVVGSLAASLYLMGPWGVALWLCLMVWSALSAYYYVEVM